jgi:hypothetical protein
MSSFGYLNGLNDYLEQRSFGQLCPPADASGAVIAFEHHQYGPGSGYEGWCTNKSVYQRNLTELRDLWDTDRPARGLNGTGFEESMFASRAVAIIESHAAAAAAQPLFLYYAMHLLVSPLCAPPEYLERFKFVREAYDDPDHARTYVCAMTSLLDDIVGDVVGALKSTGMWKHTLFIWSSDNGGAIELDTGMKNNWPLRGGYYTDWEGGIRASALVNGGFLPATAKRGSKREGAHSFLHICDWLATFGELAGYDTSDARAKTAGLPPSDSLSMWPMLAGFNETSPRTEIACNPQSYHLLKQTGPQHTGDEDVGPGLPTYGDASHVKVILTSPSIFY